MPKIITALQSLLEFLCDLGWDLVASYFFLVDHTTCTVYPNLPFRLFSPFLTEMRFSMEAVTVSNKLFMLSDILLL